jgi:DNA-binding MarR family transcriptional regulator
MAAAATPRRRSRGREASAELKELGFAFRRIFRAVNRMRGRDTHLGGEQLSHAQFELLIELFDRGELPAGELAAAAGLTPATVTQMLDHLAERGHVERARSETDRRVVVSRLTEEGAVKTEARRQQWRERWEQALDGISAEEVAAAALVLERLGTMFEQASAGEPCGSLPDPAEKGS